MTLTPEQTTALDAPLDPKRIAQRKQANITLDYLEGYDVIDKANEIFGYDGWGYRIEEMRDVTPADGRPIFEAQVTVCVITHENYMVNREDVGHGIAAGTSSEAIEMARKGAVTDALKRALRSFGNQFGNSLYDKDHAKPGRAGTQGAQGSAPRPLEAAAKLASKEQLDHIARLFHQVDDHQAMELCDLYGIGIQMKTDGQHYGAGIEAAGLTGGTHGTASQLIDALLPLVKQATKGKPAPKGAVEMADPREEPAGVEQVKRNLPTDVSGLAATPYPSPDDDIKTAGDLFTYCWKEYQMQRGEVFKLLGVEKVAEIVNPAAALKIVRHAKAKPAEPEQSALMEGE